MPAFLWAFTMNVNRYRLGMLWVAGIALLVAATLSPAQTSSTTSTTKKTTRKTHHKRKPRGQQKMDAQRVQSIQEALVREHYLSKTTGKWDVTTQQALQKYQADNGWQSKVVPDSRALIKMGLGPDNDHLLNPESAMTSTAPAAHPEDPPADPKK